MVRANIQNITAKETETNISWVTAVYKAYCRCFVTSILFIFKITYKCSYVYFTDEETNWSLGKSSLLTLYFSISLNKYSAPGHETIQNSKNNLQGCCTLYVQFKVCYIFFRIDWLFA